MRELKVQIGNSGQRAYRIFPGIFRTYKTMTLRTIKSALVFGVAIFYSFVVFNNVTDYNSNYQFERHVMMMDSTFPGNHLMWRAINTPLWHTAFYVSIIAWETLTMILCWWGGLLMVRALRGTVSAFNHAKRVSLVALALSLTMWLVVFLSVGGEWFLMWQSKSWNGQEAAFRMFTVVGIVLLVVAQPEIADQP
jgi:predicted small integral membrane protein